MKIKMYLRESSEDSLVVSEMKESGRTKLYSKWGKRLQPIHYAALLLDPRGKHPQAIPQVDKNSGKNVIQDLLKLFEEYIIKITPKTTYSAQHLSA